MPALFTSETPDRLSVRVPLSPSDVEVLNNIRQLGDLPIYLGYIAAVAAEYSDRRVRYAGETSSAFLEGIEVLVGNREETIESVTVVPNDAHRQAFWISYGQRFDRLIPSYGRASEGPEIDAEAAVHVRFAVGGEDQAEGFIELGARAFTDENNSTAHWVELVTRSQGFPVGRNLGPVALLGVTAHHMRHIANDMELAVT